MSHIDPAESGKLAALEPHVRRIQVIHVEGLDALQLIPAYEPCVHAFLLHSRRPNPPVTELGGTGRARDWAVSAALSVRPRRGCRRKSPRAYAKPECVMFEGA